nr:hypothetical protein [Spirochaeta sp.]
RWGLDSGHTLFTMDIGWGMYRGDLDSVRWERATMLSTPNPLVPETISQGRRREQYQWRFTPIAGRLSFGETLSGGDIFSSVKYVRRLGKSRWAFTAGTEVVWFGGRRANYLTDDDRIGFPTGVIRANGYGGSAAWENAFGTDYEQGVMEAFAGSWPITLTLGITFGLPPAKLRSQRVDPEMSLYTPLQGVPQ